MNGVPLFRGPVAVSDHVNLHVRFFVERTNAVGPILGQAAPAGDFALSLSALPGGGRRRL